MLRSGPLSLSSENGLSIFSFENGLRIFSSGAILNFTSGPSSFKLERPLRTFTFRPKLRFMSGAFTFKLGKPLRTLTFWPNLNFMSGPLNFRSDKPLLSWTFLGPSKLKSGALNFTFWPPLNLILRKPVLNGLLFLGGCPWAWPWLYPCSCPNPCPWPWLYPYPCPNPCPWPSFLCATGRVRPCSDFLWIPLKNLPCKGLWKVDMSCCRCSCWTWPLGAVYCHWPCCCAPAGPKPTPVSCRLIPFPVTNLGTESQTSSGFSSTGNLLKSVWLGGILVVLLSLWNNGDLRAKALSVTCYIGTL